ncbi:hypothetical protein A5696_06105 [Mycobacterium sp. E2699]|nr:hypothetical protein A5696_06105 [Mycobacterium sp. E2699]OBI51469.1 hypothetical protein A5705_08225 [Mycobacterium sp. E787]
MPDRCRNREVNGIRVERPPGRAASDPAATAHRRVSRYVIRPPSRTVRKQVTDDGGEFRLELDILGCAPRLIPLLAA